MQFSSTADLSEWRFAHWTVHSRAIINRCSGAPVMGHTWQMLYLFFNKFIADHRWKTVNKVRFPPLTISFHCKSNPEIQGLRSNRHNTNEIKWWNVYCKNRIHNKSWAHGHAISRTNGRIFHTLTASVKDFVINNLASTDWWKVWKESLPGKIIA